MDRLLTSLSTFDWQLIVLVLAAALLITSYAIEKIVSSRLSVLLDIVAFFSVFVAGILVFGDDALSLILRPTECSFDFLLCAVQRLIALWLVIVSVFVLAAAVASIRRL